MVFLLLFALLICIRIVACEALSALFSFSSRCPNVDDGGVPAWY
jgi:hypothetical protein